MCVYVHVCYHVYVHVFVHGTCVLQVHGTWYTHDTCVLWLILRIFFHVHTPCSFEAVSQ